MNYGELKAAIADWLMRSDLEPALPTFVRLAHARLNREVRARYMVKRAVSQVDGHFLRLPTDWLEAKNVQLNTHPVRPLRLVSLQEADKIRASGSRGRPTSYAIVGDELEIVPVTDDGTEIEMTYYAAIPELVEDTDTNWLLERWPDLYLFASLVSTAPYMKEDERMPLWESMYTRVFEEMRTSDLKAQHSGAPVITRTRPIG